MTLAAIIAAAFFVFCLCLPALVVAGSTQTLHNENPTSVTLELWEKAGRK